MKVTRQDIAQKIIDYLFHRITLSELVNWAEMSMMDADFEERNYDTLRDITSRLGLADVKAFGVTWEECESFLQRLGYRVDLKVTEIQAM
ncbi:hypothetical protein L7E55_04455 [Pelotomaculum isophthalicicum JI]|uniref:Uncharacterized protein n=1 Tax=Pelotomaculum isophthalicicum JI TaxID=947010 RepID=A0A9X4JTL7_9FIRM|nr:hypothetical protein [Pelotomaculum isophthalicicum]MDF9407615.1 hypothetical protein [Pelotomaculum isophthalicicum JI]